VGPSSTPSAGLLPLASQPVNGPDGRSPGDATPTVSVIVPVFNEASQIRQAIAAMRGQRVPGGFELLVVDGRSTDGTGAIVAELAEDDARVILLENPQRHIPNALNIGLAAVRGAYVARMDAHTYYPLDYLARGIDRLQQGDVAWVAGPQIPKGRDLGSRRVARALRSRLGVGGASFRTELAQEIETDAGFTGVWRRSTLEELGGWDEEWLVNEDGELAARVRDAGGRIVCVPAMAADYLPRSDLRSLAKQYWRYGQYRAKTSVRHPTSMRRSHVLPPGVVVTALLAALPGRAGRPFRVGAAAYLAALVATTAKAASGAEEDLAVVLAMPAVLLTMHACWGAGFIVGAARFGVSMGVPARVLKRGRCRPARTFPAL